MVAEHGACDHDLKEEIKILVKLLVRFPSWYWLVIDAMIMMIFLPILQVKGGKTSPKVISIKNSVSVSISISVSVSKIQ